MSGYKLSLDKGGVETDVTADATTAGDAGIEVIVDSEAFVTAHECADHLERVAQRLRNSPSPIAAWGAGS